MVRRTSLKLPVHLKKACDITLRMFFPPTEESAYEGRGRSRSQDWVGLRSGRVQRSSNSTGEAEVTWRVKRGSVGVMRGEWAF